MAKIAKLGHAGLYVTDMDRMKDFYTRVLGLEVTNENPAMVFMSSSPDDEHHELFLVRGRQATEDTRTLHHLSWRLDGIDDLLDFHQRFKAEGVRIEETVTHGYAIGIYFWDPEGNQNEVYTVIEDWRRTFRKAIDLDQDAKAILEDAERLKAEAVTEMESARH